MKGVIGFTTTIPVEIVFAGGFIPCDLNNVFITDDNPMHFVERAERDGFPKNICTWIKGIYGVVMERNIESVVTVMEGDCSNTQALAEILRYRGINTIPFSYPYDRDGEVLKREMEKLKDALGVDEKSLCAVEDAIRDVRSRLRLIDTMTWRDRVVTGYENHLWLVRSSDMMGDAREYGVMADDFLNAVKTRDRKEGMNIGYIGVPPILLDLYPFLESLGTHVVYNETQRQFAIPCFSENIVDRYLQYTYPYGIFSRLEDIKAEVARREISGIIHYVQAFCFRAIEDVILRETLDIPVMTVEGDLPRTLDARTKLRIEAFIEMLKGKMDGEGEKVYH